MKFLRSFKISIIVGVLAGILIGFIDLFPFTICISVFLSFFPGLIAANWFLKKNPDSKAISIANVSFFTGIFCGTMWAISKFILAILLGGLGLLSSHFGNETLTFIFIVATILIFLIFSGLILLVGCYNSLMGVAFYKFKKWYQAKKIEELNRAKIINPEEVKNNYSDYIEAEYNYIEEN